MNSKKDYNELQESVCCIIVNYNAGTLLADCVAAAIEQTGKLILVDNASYDHSLEAVTTRFPGNTKLEIIYSGKNIGFAAACNLGASVATGKYLLFLNPDCILQSGAVRQMLNALQTGDEVGMVGGLLLNPDGTEQGGGRRAVPTPWRSFVRAFGLYRFADRWPTLFFDFYLHKQPLPLIPIVVEAISGACMLVSEQALHDVGPWDEGFFLHCEDLDWCMRFRQKGWKILFVPNAPVVHYQGTCSLNKPCAVEWHKHKGMVRFYQKFFKRQYPGPLMWLVVVGVWLRFFLVAGRCAYSRLSRRVA